MTPIEKVKFKFLCNEDLNKMSPCSTGLNCSSCNKTVIDFRKSELSNLTKALEEHGTVCGIFSKQQIAHNHKKTTNLLKRYAASLLFALGFGLFQKDLIAQNNELEELNHKHVLGKDKTQFFVGMIDETLPIYKNGGEEGLIKFLKKNLKFPKDSVQRKIYLDMTIDTTGKVIDAKFLRYLNKSSEIDLMRLVENLEFTPGIQGGKKVQVHYTIPITLIFDDEKKFK